MSTEFDSLFETEGLNENEKTLFESLTDEQKAIIAKRASDKTQNLVKNRDAILEEKRLEEERRKAAEEKIRLAEEQAKKIKADLEAAELEKELEAAKKGEDSKKLLELQNQAFEKEKQELLNRQKEIEERASALLKEKVDLTLSNALSQLNITKDGFNGVKTLMKSRMEVNDDNEIFLEGAPLDEYLAAWRDSDEGKFYIKATPLNGSGAHSGSGGKGSAKTWKEMSVDERAFMRKNEPEKAAELSKSA